MIRTVKASVAVCLGVATVAMAGCETYGPGYGYDYGPGRGQGHGSAYGQYGYGERQPYGADNRTCFYGERASDCRERIRWEQQQDTSYRYEGGRYYEDRRNDQTGAALVGGVLGFVLGAAIAGNDDDRNYWERRRGDRRYLAECGRRYRGWDRNSGTYLGNDGYRRYCRY